MTCTNVWSLAINPDDVIFAGTAGCGTGVFRSTDNGNNWTLVNNGLTSTDITSLIIDSHIDLYDIIYAGTLSQMGSGGGVFRSTDNGETWTEQNNGLTNFDVTSLVVNHYDSVANVFAGTPIGIFQSTDNGENWFELPDGLTSKDVRTLESSWDGFVFAGTAGGGVFRSTHSTTPVENENNFPSGFVLKQNYPNPFNPKTKIQYRISSQQFVSLKVYNILGREISTLVNEENPAGSYEVEFNAVGTSRDLSLPSGVYFYQLKAGNYIETKKMILMK